MPRLSKDTILLQPLLPRHNQCQLVLQPICKRIALQCTVSCRQSPGRCRTISRDTSRTRAPGRCMFQTFGLGARPRRACCSRSSTACRYINQLHAHWLRGAEVADSMSQTPRRGALCVATIHVYTQTGQAQHCQLEARRRTKNADDWTRTRALHHLF